MSASVQVAGREPVEPAATGPEKDGRSGKRIGFKKLRAEDADGEARRLAAAILEVLAGGRTPTEAAQSLGVSPPRYYALEQRALEGLLTACRPRQRGRVRTSESEAEKLRAEVKRLERECGRWQALLRAAQRTVGLAAPRPAAPSPGQKRRPRRSRVARALRAAKALKGEARPVKSREPLEKGGGSRDDAPAVVK